VGTQIVCQPNGKYAVWSSVVDDFVLLDATPEDIIDDWSATEVQRITEHVCNIVAALARNEKPYYQFTRSFEECVKIIRQRRGDNAETLKHLNALGNSP
jgi:hypothetical protein